MKARERLSPHPEQAREGLTRTDYRKEVLVSACQYVHVPQVHMGNPDNTLKQSLDHFPNTVRSLTWADSTLSAT